MFPIIPQFFTGKIIDSGEMPVRKVFNVETKSNSKISSSRRFVASSIIEKNSCSEEFNASDILNETETCAHEEVRVFSNHHDVMTNSSKSWSWLKDANLADDCHSYNVELRATENSSSSQHFRLKATRSINVDDQLVLWFSHEVLIRLQIPHLTLTNIRGEKQYICHKCPFQCEMPNPLKIHLALECDRLPRSYLWQRLLHTKCTIDAPLTPLLNPISSVQMTKFVKSKSTNSAFKPYRKSVFKNNSNRLTESEKTTKTHSTMPITLNQDFTNTQSNFLYKQAVEMETIVSNLGRFKQGHLCIYCGKVYSRKYGLKIHIRTHTGFKPLKCKFCLRPFGDPSNLNKHVRLHSDGDTPYKCEQCGKILVRKRDLERHIKSRH